MAKGIANTIPIAVGSEITMQLSEAQKTKNQISRTKTKIKNHYSNTKRNLFCDLNLGSWLSSWTGHFLFFGGEFPVLIFKTADN
jgi:hypothetical protein